MSRTRPPLIPGTTNLSSAFNSTLKIGALTDGTINIAEGRITGLLNPVNNGDAANKAYVDATSGGGSSPGGTTGALQYNDNGALNGMNLYYDGSNSTVSLSSGENNDNPTEPIEIKTGVSYEFNTGRLNLGTGDAATSSGLISLQSGNSNNGVSGNVLLKSGSSNNNNSGNILISTGGAPSGTSGNISLSNGSGSVTGIVNINDQLHINSQGVNFSHYPEMIEVTEGPTATIDTNSAILFCYLTTPAMVSAKLNISCNKIINPDTAIIIVNVRNYVGTGIPVISTRDVYEGAFTIVITNSHPTDAMNDVVEFSFIVVNSSYTFAPF